MSRGIRGRRLLGPVVGSVVLASMAVWPSTTVANAAATPPTYHWIGTSHESGGDGTSWTDPLNWRPHAVPGAGDSVEIKARPDTACGANVTAIPEGTVLHSLLLTASQGCHASLSDGSLTVTDTLDWSGGDVYTPLTVAHGARYESNAFGAGIGLGTTLTIAGYMQLIESTLHSLNADAVLHITSTGRFDGDESTVEPAVVNDGRVSTLLQFPVVTSFGSFVQHRDGRLNLVAISQLSVAGSLDVAGTVTYMTGRDYDAQLGDTHEVLAAGGESRWHPSCQTTVGRGHKIAHWQPAITRGRAGITITVTYTAGKVHGCPSQ